MMSRIVSVQSNLYDKLHIEMLEVPKAHLPKQRDEICSNVTVTKVEKSNEMVYG